MHEDEKWQVFNNNGTPAIGVGATQDDFKADNSLIMGNSHVWFWKKNGNSIDILLQKRSLTKNSKPGWYHISAGGHINAGETSVEAALREAKEEMDIELNVDKLHYSFSTRIIGRAPNDIVSVFLYRLAGDEEFSHRDGEVESYEWRSFKEFKKITSSPQTNNVVNQGRLYFTSLINSLEYVALGSNKLL